MGRAIAVLVDHELRSVVEELDDGAVFRADFEAKIDGRSGSRLLGD